jgi:EAL domain-containing protein (putative c-di-GMP-specific phosphodiesterase class I)
MTDLDRAAREDAVLDAFQTAFDGDGSFALRYQPRLDLGTGRWVAAEALLRWFDPALGWIEPTEFIPLLEHAGSIRPVTRWVIRRILSDRRATGLALPISVNVSALDLAEPGFARAVVATLHAAGVPPSLLELEITETARFRPDSASMASLARLAAAGISVAIDDFGAGHSNLAALLTIPARTVKLDRTLTRDIERSERAGVVVRTMIRLAGELGMEVVAEGVETAGMLALLTGWGCGQAQGWHVARPMTLAELVAGIAEGG